MTFAEPLGLLQGADAAAAVAAGIAVPLAGGPAAFTLFRYRDTAVPVSQVGPAVLAPYTARQHDWAGLGAGPLVMGILNATPDSFSDGGANPTLSGARAAAERMLAEGADIIDIGGESTRPGARPTDPAEEQARILPLVAALARSGAVISIDTRNAATMERALDAGARIVNDVSALRHDPGAARLVASRECPVILMHMRGTPATMNGLASYADVAAEVTAELAAHVAAAVAAGVAPDAIMIDPGFGFAKDAGQSLELLQRMPALLALGHPIVAGLSRKAVIGRLTGERDPKQRLAGSLAAALQALDRGARIVRVHDVAETVQAAKVWRAAVQTSLGPESQTANLTPSAR